MPSVDDSMAKTVEPSNISKECIDGVVDDNPKGMMLKDGTPMGGDVMSPSVIDTVNNLEVEGTEGMNVDISSAIGTEPVTVGSIRDDVVRSVANTGAEITDLPEKRSMPTVGQGVADKFNVDVEESEILKDNGTSVINTGETIVEDIFEGSNCRVKCH
ncbi:hypothetical protein LIER_03921 [Lithospermum erythrorhizon]|uniref:Uncharacterized protein n=1 Tax=Lithospermum erythrorhizon TaxID=34254 RepID=A0AAV3NWD4_LITER